MDYIKKVTDYFGNPDKDEFTPKDSIATIGGAASRWNAVSRNKALLGTQIDRSIYEANQIWSKGVESLDKVDRSQIGNVIKTLSGSFGAISDKLISDISNKSASFNRLIDSKKQRISSGISRLGQLEVQALGQYQRHKWDVGQAIKDAGSAAEKLYEEYAEWKKNREDDATVTTEKEAVKKLLERD